MQILIARLKATLSLKVREQQGFPYIRLTSTAEDWEVLQKLYALQLEALTMSATGDVQDLDKWYVLAHGSSLPLIVCACSVCMTALRLFMTVCLDATVCSDSVCLLCLQDSLIAAASVSIVLNACHVHPHCLGISMR